MSGYWRLPEVAATVSQAKTEALTLGAEHLKTVSVSLAPVDEATLRRSATVDVQGHEAAVSYGTKYAPIQHEALHYHHPKGGQAKYLEAPLHDEADVIRAIIAIHLKRNLGGSA